jgi:hypothetical protein
VTFEKGFCRIETKNRVIFGEITEIKDSEIVLADFTPFANEVKVKKTDIVHYETVKEEDIPAYE